PPPRPRPPLPFAFQRVRLVTATTAAVFVLRPVMDARMASAVYAAAGLLVLNLAIQLLQMPAELEQGLLIFELGSMAALLLWAAARLGRATHSSWLRRIGRDFMRVLALGCGASALAAAFGYLDLATFVGVGLFYGFFLAFALQALRVVLQHLVTIGLARGPAARLHAIARHRALLERRLRKA